MGLCKQIFICMTVSILTSIVLFLGLSTYLSYVIHKKIAISEQLSGNSTLNGTNDTTTMASQVHRTGRPTRHKNFTKNTYIPLKEEKFKSKNFPLKFRTLTFKEFKYDNEWVGAIVIMENFKNEFKVYLEDEKGDYIMAVERYRLEVE